MTLIESILNICHSCGLAEDKDKSVSETGVTVPIKNGKWTKMKISQGERGYAMCLTEKHISESKFSRGNSEILYLDTFCKDGEDPFILNLWLFLPIISNEGKLIFVKRASEKELYKKDLIMNGLSDTFIITDGVYESYIPEISCTGCDSAVIDILKRYITNVAEICKTFS